MGASGSLPIVKERSVSCFVGTWNLGNVVPSNFDWIPASKNYDLYVIGVQEAAFEKDGAKIDMYFQRAFDHLLGKTHVCIAYESLTPRTDHTFKEVHEFKSAVMRGEAKSSGIRIVAYMKRELTGSNHTVNVETFIQTCGRLQGTSGNKGAVAIAVTFDGARIAFVNNHLNAHMEMLPRRLTDYEVISRRLHHSHDTFGEIKHSMVENENIEYSVELMNKTDAIFWFGDLNMRLQPLENLEMKEDMRKIVTALVGDKRYKDLLGFDQLKAEQKKGTFLSGFEEGEIGFPPTFKFNKVTSEGGDKASKSGEGTSEGGDEDECVVCKKITGEEELFMSDESSNGPNMKEKLDYSKKRVPSYCDRILWKTAEGTKVECIDYDSWPFLQTSDHLPVFGIYNIQSRLIVEPHPTEKALKMTVRNVCLDPSANNSQSQLIAERSEDDGDPSVSIVIYHNCATSEVVLPAHCGPNFAWPGPFVLETSSSIDQAMTSPVLFLVRDYDGVGMATTYGEGMLSPRDLSQRTASIELYQGGKPHGVLTADVEFSAVATGES